FEGLTAVLFVAPFFVARWSRLTTRPLRCRTFNPECGGEGAEGEPEGLATPSSQHSRVVFRGSTAALFVTPFFVSRWSRLTTRPRCGEPFVRDWGGAGSEGDPE